MGDLGGFQLRALLEATPLAVAACDAEGRLTLVSPALEALLGPYEPISVAQYAARVDLRDRDGTRPLPPDDMPMLRALRGEVVHEAVVTARAPDGRMLCLRFSAAPVTDSHEGPIGAVALVVDVTAEQAAARERAELRNRLVETVNHELRTPLTKIHGHAELLLDVTGDLPTQHRRSLQAIAQATHDLSRLVRAISDLADLQTFTRVSHDNVDLVELAQEVAAEARHRFPNQCHNLVLQAPDSLTAMADAVKLRRALLELISNAAMYGPYGSEILVRLARDERGDLLTVRDAGTGIPPHDRARLIAPFERGNHPSQPVNSRGLGLAIAHGVATGHGGELTFSEHPTGFDTTIRLPPAR